MRRCRFCLSIASAMMNPPKYKKTFESAYAKQTFLAPMMPSSGYAASGIKLTAGILSGRAIHRIAITTDTAAVR